MKHKGKHIRLRAPKTKPKTQGSLLITRYGKINIFLYPPEQREALRAVENLADICGYEATHTRQVTRMALSLFDQLFNLHHLAANERFYLECAGILHDIGWIEGWKGHHKKSLNIILRTPLLPFNNRERLMIGSIARYHTKALPSLDHDHFAALEPEDRQLVLTLSSLLRLADSLDYTHSSQIEDLAVRVSPRKISIFYTAPGRLRKDEKAAQKGFDLMQRTFERSVIIKWNPD